MHIIDYAKSRYSTKLFDNTKKIDGIDLSHIKELLRLSPSSVNGQPWYFIIAGSGQSKELIAKATQGPYSFNLNKILDASHIIVFCARTNMDDDYLQRLTYREQEDGRFPSEEAMNEQHKKRSAYVNRHKNIVKDLPEWTARQVYLNLGAFLIGVSIMGLDAVPIEGFDRKIIDEEFGLKDKEMSSMVLVAVGYRSSDDSNAKLPKSRLSLGDIITEL